MNPKGILTMKKMFLNGKERNLYKVNCHTHSTTSDGLFTPETIARLYNRTGYDAIFLTDHRQTNKISEIQTVLKEKYLANITLISGIE
jgi:predicted metal-dependent phosphoesterase TrpH